MHRFAQLYVELDRTASTSAKRDAMAAYFAAAPAADSAWAVYVLSGGKLKRTATATELRLALAQATGYADWLIEDSYQHVGDFAETVALMLPEQSTGDHDIPLGQWMELRLPALGKLESAQRVATVIRWWQDVPREQVFVLNKLLTGSLRVGVSRRLVVLALAQWADLPSDLLAHRLSGDWRPNGNAMSALRADAGMDEGSPDRPYPFYLASPLEAEPATLGDRAAWLAEWKWDGIRAQLMRRGFDTRLWSRGEERLDGRFPEIETAATAELPDGVVLDGEILAWEAPARKPRPFTALQRRIGKLKPGLKLLADVPVCFMAYDVLEAEGRDLRHLPLRDRRALLASLMPDDSSALLLSPPVAAPTWEALAQEREQSREHLTEGLMLKHVDSPYRVGRKRGDWWKWKIDPYTIDAVLLYAQPGHGRRSGLFTDYTFGVWDGDALVAVAKAYSGLDDQEIARLDKWIRANTMERFGPVRSVPAEHVFELAFEAIQASSRHKSGVAVRFPRIARWRTDLAVGDADKLDDLRRLASGLSPVGATGPIDG
ncbi:ATP-dependent DNA ligase [Pinirhizobacter sp.]|jgi:DNA ligase-1|uniref:ATP-dependent DNA ligase n=1 Tax=Pinirhizobacter sp. TaxID=2950432 RepID=UPI002F3FA1C7